MSLTSTFCVVLQPCNEPTWRYMVQLSAADHTATQWLTAFGEVGEQLFGMPAADFRHITMDPTALERAVTVSAA